MLRNYLKSHSSFSLHLYWLRLSCFSKFVLLWLMSPIEWWGASTSFTLQKQFFGHIPSWQNQLDSQQSNIRATSHDAALMLFFWLSIAICRLGKVWHNSVKFVWRRYTWYRYLSMSSGFEAVLVAENCNLNLGLNDYYLEPDQCYRTGCPQNYAQTSLS